jgi:hypothetical protein
MGNFCQLIQTFTIFSEQTSNLLSSAVFYADIEKHKMILLVLVQKLTTVLTDRIIYPDEGIHSF